MWDVQREQELVGATILYTWDGEGEPMPGYVSFGSYDEEWDCDEYGVSDEYIFFYPESPQDLLEQAGGLHGWRLLEVIAWHYQDRWGNEQMSYRTPEVD